MYEIEIHENYKNTIICEQCSMFHSLSSQLSFIFFIFIIYIIMYLYSRLTFDVLIANGNVLFLLII